jgi:hypothetical protein
MQKFVSGLCSLLTVFIAWSAGMSLAHADPLQVTYKDVTTGYTVTYNSGGADPNNDFNVDSGSLPVFYASNKLSYSISGTANPPGTSLDSPGVAFLSTTEAKVTNTSSITHEIQITFTATPFSLPTNGPVIIGTQINTNQATGDAGGSTLTTSATGGLLDLLSSPFSRSESLGWNDLLEVFTLGSKTGNYTLLQTYDVFVKAGGTVKAQLRMDVQSAGGTLPTPEPWNIVAACATFLPVGLLYLGLRRRKIVSNS